MTYARPFWRDAGLSGAIVDSTSLISSAFDVCLPDGAAALLVFVAGRANLEWTDHTPQGDTKCACDGVIDAVRRAAGGDPQAFGGVSGPRGTAAAGLQGAQLDAGAWYCITVHATLNSMAVIKFNNMSL